MNIKKIFIGGGIAALFLVLIMGRISFADLTFTGTNISSDGSVVLDASSTISIGTSTATGIMIGRSGSTVTLPGNLAITALGGAGSHCLITNASGTVATSTCLESVSPSFSLSGVLNVPGSYASATIIGSPLVVDGASNNPYNMVVQGSIGYMTTQGGNPSQLILVNLATPSAPTVLSQTTGLSTYMNGIAVQGKYVYVTYYGNSELQIFNVSNPAAPVSVGTASTCSGPYGGMVVSGDYAYIPCPNNGATATISIMNVSNPAAPVQVGTFSSLASTNVISLAVSGQMLYAEAGSETGTSYITAYSIVNPSSPSLLGSVAVDHSPQKIAVEGTTVVASDHDTNEINVIDFSNPSSAQVYNVALTSGCFPETENDITLQGNLVLVGCSGGGVGVVDISTISSPKLLGVMLSSLGDITAVIPYGRYIYLGSYTSPDLYTVDFGGAYVQQFSAGTIRADRASVRGILDAGSLSIQGGIHAGSAMSTDADFNALGNGYFALNVGIGTTNPSTTLQVTGGATPTIRIGAGPLPGCLEIMDSSGNGAVNYITATGGVLTATTTKPAVCG